MQTYKELILPIVVFPFFVFVEVLLKLLLFALVDYMISFCLYLTYASEIWALLSRNLST